MYRHVCERAHTRLRPRRTRGRPTPARYGPQSRHHWAGGTGGLGGVTGSQTLLIDADDTLWENNIYFERAIARFISFLNHHEFSPEQIREVLNDVERECIVKHGYGLNSFAHALVDTFERLSVEPMTPELHAQIHSFSHTITDHPIETLPEVRETLEYLSKRHRLILMTKGAIPEQTGRVERSGLKTYFDAVEIVAGKHAAPYSSVIQKNNLTPHSPLFFPQTPKPHPTPALAAGTHAVFMPHWGTVGSATEEGAAALAPRRGPLCG